MAYSIQYQSLRYCEQRRILGILPYSAFPFIGRLCCWGLVIGQRRPSEVNPASCCLV